MSDTLINYLPANIKITYYAIGQTIFFLWNASLVAIILYLFHKIINPIKFSNKNAGLYFNECSMIIANGVETDIQQLTTEVFFSIPEIFDYALQNNESKVSQYAISLIILFSDEIFCIKLVNHNPETLYQIFKTVINNCNSHQSIGRNFINRLILLMFTEPRSQLHREEPYHGLGRFETFKKLIFSNIDFLKSPYHPLSIRISNNKDDFDNGAIKKYFDIVKFSLENYLQTINTSMYLFLVYINEIFKINSSDIITIRYLDTVHLQLKIKLNEFDVLSTIFYSALQTIVEIIRKNIYALDQYTENEIGFSSPFNNLIACSSGALSLIHYIIENDDKLLLSEDIIDTDYNYFTNDKNIYGALANGIYEIIESLSMSNYTYESIRLLLMEIYTLHFGQRSHSLNSIRIRLDILLKNKIEHNLTDLCYPAVTARLIYTFGLCEPDKTDLPIHKVLLTELKNKYLRIYNSNPEIALDMIPKDTEINEPLKKLIRKHAIRWIRNKTVEELILEE